MQSLWSFSALRKVMNGLRLTVGQLHSLGIVHSVALMTQLRSLKVPRWRRWANTIGEVNNVDVPAMVRAARAANKEHAQQVLDTIADLWRQKMPRQFKLTDLCRWVQGVAAEGGQNGVVCGNGVNGQIDQCPSITHKFMYRVLWKKL